VTGRVRVEIFDLKFKKIRSNPKITHKITGQPNPTWPRHGPGMGQYFLTRNPKWPDPTDDDAYFMEHVNARRVVRKCKCATALNHMHGWVRKQHVVLSARRVIHAAGSIQKKREVTGDKLAILRCYHILFYHAVCLKKIFYLDLHLEYRLHHFYMMRRTKLDPTCIYFEDVWTSSNLYVNLSYVIEEVDTIYIYI
jgi:hypothetical protein